MLRVKIVKLMSIFMHSFFVQVVEEVTRTDGVCLEPIAQTTAAQFQSWTTGFEYQQVQRLNKRQVMAAVGPNGRELPR